MTDETAFVLIKKQRRKTNMTKTNLVTASIAALLALAFIPAPTLAADPHKIARAKALMETADQCDKLQYVSGSARYPYRFRAFNCRAPHVTACGRWFHPTVVICIGRFRETPTRMGMLYGYRHPLICEGSMFYQVRYGETRRLRKYSWRCQREAGYDRAAIQR